MSTIIRTVFYLVVSLQRMRVTAIACFVVMGALTGCWVPPTTSSEDPGGSPFADFSKGNILITAEALAQKLGSPDLVIMDASGADVYAAGHIPGAVHIGFHGLSDTSGKKGDPGWGTILPPGALVAKLRALGVGRDSLVVVYSDILKGPGSCGRTVWQLQVAGIQNVRLLAGGLQGWKRAGYATTQEPTLPSPTAGPTVTAYNDTMRIQKDELRQRLGQITVIDVRSPEEFSGEDHSRGEARPGHIEGAVSLPWKKLLDEYGAPKPAEEIVAIMAAAGVERGDNFVVY